VLRILESIVVIREVEDRFLERFRSFEGGVHAQILH
jgi:hypothetical protein